MQSSQSSQSQAHSTKPGAAGTAAALAARQEGLGLLQSFGVTAKASEILFDKNLGMEIVTLAQTGKLARPDFKKLSELVKGMPANGVTEDSIKLLCVVACNKSITAKDLRLTLDLLSTKPVAVLGVNEFKELGKLADPRREVDGIQLAFSVMHETNVNSSGERAVAALGKVVHSVGRLDIFRRFLDTMGTRDPFEALERAQCIVPTNTMRVKFLKEQAAAAGGDADTSGEKLGETVKLASGTVSSSERIYLIYSNTDARRGMFLGEVATTSLYETLNSNNPEKAQRRSATEELNSRLRQFAALTLDKLLASEGTKEALKSASPLVGRALGVFEELTAANAKLKEELRGHAEGAGMHIAAATLQRMNLKDDPGGGVLKRLAREGAELPDIIRTAMDNVTAPHVKHDSALVATCWETMVLYLINKEYTRTTLVTNAISEDLLTWKALKPEDPLKAPYAELFKELEGSLKKLEKSTPAVPVSEAGLILQQNKVLEFREAYNKRVWAVYGKEVEQTIENFRPLFMTDASHWRPDCIPVKVPNRLKESRYGTKLGFDIGTYNTDVKLRQAVLKSDEFRAILKMLYAKSVSAGSESALLRSTSALDFERNIINTVIAGRKARYADAALGGEFTQIPLEGDATRLEAIAAKSPRLLLGGYHDFLPFESRAERFSGLTAAEIIDRNDGKANYSMIGSLSKMAHAALGVGLIPQDEVKTIAALAKNLATLVSTDTAEIQADLLTMKSAYHSPFVTLRKFQFVYPDSLLKAKFIKDSELTAVRRVAELVKGAGLDFNSAEFKSAEASWSTLRDLNLVRLTPLPSEGKALIKSLVYSDEVRRVGSPNEFEYIDVAKVNQINVEVAKNGQYVHCKNLPPAWFSKARSVAQSLDPAVNAELQGVLRLVSQAYPAILTRDLVDFVEKHEVKREPQKAQGMEVMRNPAVSRWLAVTTGQVTLNFGNAQHRGASLLQMAQSNPGFIAWALHKDRSFPPEAKAVMQAASDFMAKQTKRYSALHISEQVRLNQEFISGLEK